MYSLNYSPYMYSFPATIGVAMNELIVVHCMRPDRLMASAHRLVAAAFGDGFMQQDKVIDLHDIIDNEVILNAVGRIRSLFIIQR